MHAMVFDRYGGPEQLHLKEVPTPQPKDNEVLVRVEAAALNASDWRFLRADPFIIRFAGFGLLRPKYRILGSDVAGTVAAVGAKVTRFREGDAVYGCLFTDGFGAFAEYVSASESTLLHKPQGLSMAQAAASPAAGLTAVIAWKERGPLRPGQRVLIHGASGGVGTFALQLAKHHGAEVTAVVSTRNVALARELGADHVIDYRTEDFAQRGQRWEFILAVNGNRRLADYRRVLTPDGDYLMVGGSIRHLLEGALLAPLLSRFSAQTLGAPSQQLSAALMEELNALLTAGAMVPVIDRSFPLAELPAAFRYMENEHASGKVVITV